MSDTPEFVGVVQDGKVLLDWRKQFDAYVTQFEGEEVVLEIRKRRSKRSDKQNRALHACLGRWAAEKGHDVEEIKDDLLALLWGYHVRQSRITGEVVKSLVKPHTSRLNTQEFCDLFDLAAEEAAKDGHYMLMPDEYLAAKADAAKKAAKAASKAAQAA